MVNKYIRRHVSEHKWGNRKIGYLPYIFQVTFLSEISGEHAPHIASIYKYFFENNIFRCRRVCPPGLQKGPAEDCLMIVGSCIKCTAAGGERGEHIQSGCFGGWGCGGVESVRKAQAECLGAESGCESVMAAEKGSYSLDLKSFDLCLSDIFFIQHIYLTSRD